ncbi:probable hexokinase [Cephalotrichum gorgonifer]|uniref:Phosphotransferase n=1 Tax=Cephalotrichum gorgonifer TaxID=2041049 RepID=A0AAE8MVA6_9PEZI|nr:probable hexokinase [Cephalotrichum gorgonifer]
MADLPQPLLEAVKVLEEQFTVTTDRLKAVTDRFASELEKGLSVEGGTIPMNPTWVMAVPDGHETGTFLALDMGGTNLRVCKVTLSEKKSEFEIVQSKYRIPEELKSGESEDLWDYMADCVKQFLKTHHALPTDRKLPLGFTFSYPATQHYIDHGILQRWTKGFDVSGVEGNNVVPLFEAALQKQNVPVVVSALTNDTTGTLIASAYTNTRIKMGCIFGTGCNAAYIEDCGSIPKLAHLNLPPDMPMIINCEYGAFDNERVVLPLTPYDEIIDEMSPRQGQQMFEKMVAGLYLGELWRLAALDLHKKGLLFKGQDVPKLTKPYSLDSSFLSAIEEDAHDDLKDTKDIVESKLGATSTLPERRVMRRLAELIGTRAARLSACGIAAVCKKKGWDNFQVGADGSVFEKYPHFKTRQSQALREILDWPEGTDANGEHPIEVHQSEDGSGVGAALIAALTFKRVQAGNLAGIVDPVAYSEIVGASVKKN